MKKIKILICFFSLTFYFNFVFATKKIKNPKTEVILNENLKEYIISELDQEKIKTFLEESIKEKNNNQKEIIINNIKNDLIFKTINFFKKNEEQQTFVCEYQYFNLEKENKIKLNSINFIFKKQNNQINLINIFNLNLKTAKSPINLNEKIFELLKNIWQNIEKKQNYFIEQNFENIAENFKKSINKKIKKNPFKKRYIHKEELNLIPKKNNLKTKKIKIIFTLYENKEFKEKLKLNIKIEN